MQIYRDEATLARIVSRMMAQALQLHQPVLIIATPSSLEKIVAGIEAEGIPIEERRRSGDVHVLDSREMLDALLVNGMPDAGRFRSLVGALLTSICQGREPCFVVIYADMADLLVRADNTAGAIALELFWNRLARTHQFSLTCGYAAADVSQRIPTLEELQVICEQHNMIRSLPN